MAISLRLDNNDTMLIKKCAELKKLSVSEFIRQTVMERIEDEFDLIAYKKAVAEYQENPVTYTLDDIEKELLEQ